MTTEISNELRCFWCNSPGAGDEKFGGFIKNVLYVEQKLNIK